MHRLNANDSARSCSRFARLSALRVLTSRTTCPVKSVWATVLQHLRRLLVCRQAPCVLVFADHAPLGQMECTTGDAQLDPATTGWAVEACEIQRQMVVVPLGRIQPGRYALSSPPGVRIRIHVLDREDDPGFLGESSDTLDETPRWPTPAAGRGGCTTTVSASSRRAASAERSSWTTGRLHKPAE